MTNQNHAFANRCERCNSSDWQSLELAHSQSVRETEGGYRSISILGESIAPPERRSLLSSPAFSAAGLGSGTLLFLPLLTGKQPAEEWLSTPLFEPHVYVPALVVAAIVFATKLFNAIRYNTVQWPSRYLEWQSTRICRKCGHISTASSLEFEPTPRRNQ